MENEKQNVIAVKIVIVKTVIVPSMIAIRNVHM